MAWEEEYRAKRSTAEQAVQVVQSGQRVILGTLGSEPQTLVEALIADRARLREVELLAQLGGSRCPYAQPGMEQHFRVITVLSSAAMRDAMRAGHADFIPVHLSEIPRLFYEGYLPLDVAMIQVSPPDRNGYCSLGIAVDILKAAAECAKVVVAEVNERMPRALGDCFIHIADIDHVVETSRALIQVPPTKLGEAELAIGRHVAGLIEDRATIQLGIGSIPNAVLGALRDRRDLGVHSGLFSEGVMDLMEAGVVTGRYKPINRGKVVATDALGTERLYSFMHDNPAIEMHPASYTHNAAVLDRLVNFVAINSALQIDLTGQVNAETLGGAQIGGVGGQLDFVRAAARVPGGKSVIALLATAAGDTVSRIVPRLEEGAPVTTPRHDVHYVATEFGVVELRGKTLRQRAEALASIAHPKFREALSAWRPGMPGG